MDADHPKLPLHFKAVRFYLKVIPFLQLVRIYFFFTFAVLSRVIKVGQWFLKLLEE